MRQFTNNFDDETHSATRTINRLTAEQFLQDIRRSRVVVLAANPCINDTRIVRSAEAVAAAGYEVTVLAPRTSEPRYEIVNGVRYVRLDLTELDTDQSFLNIVFQLLFSKLFNITGPRFYFFENIKFYIRKICILGKFILSSIFTAVLEFLSSFPGIETVLQFDYRSLRKSKNVLIRCLSRIYWPVISIWRLACRVRAVARSMIKRMLVSYHHQTSKLKKWLLGLAKSNAVTYFLVRRYIVLFADEIRKLEPDIIHAHDLHTLPAAVKAAAGSSTRVIYDSHELECHKNIQSSWFDLWLRRAVERKYIQRTEAVVTVCDSIADHLAHAYSIRRPSVVMNSTSISRRIDADSAADIRSDIGLSRHQPLAVYIGRVTIGRGVEQTVEALQYLPDMHLALLGSAHLATLQTVMELSKRIGVQDRVHVMPPVPSEEVTAYVTNADISVVAIQNVCLSYYFCLPNKLFESVAAGLPVVVSDFPELRRFVETSKSGLIVNQTDPHKIASAMQKAYANRASLQLKDEQLEAINQIYGWEAQKAILLQIYSDLAVEYSLPLSASRTD